MGGGRERRRGGVHARGRRERGKRGVRPQPDRSRDTVDLRGVRHTEGVGTTVLRRERDAQLIAGVDGLAEAEARPAMVEPALAEGLENRGDSPSPDRGTANERPGETELAGELGGVAPGS